MRRILVGWLVTLAVVASVPAAACIGSQLNSIHFHSGRPDFGLLPRRGLVWEGDDRHIEDYVSWPVSGRVGVELEPVDDTVRDANHLRLLKKANGAFLARDWDRAIRLFDEVQKRFGKSGTVIDRIELARAFRADPRFARRVRGADREYAESVPLYRKSPQKSADIDDFELDLGPAVESALRRIAANHGYGLLRDHAAYQLASLSWESGRPLESLPLFRQYLAAFPRGRKREEALIMMARAALLGDKPAERSVSEAGWALDRLRTEFPRSRFRRAALGLRGRIFYLTGEYRRALDCYFALGDAWSVEKVRAAGSPNIPSDTMARLLAAYLRRLASARTYYIYSVTLADIERTRKSFTVRDARIFSRMLDRDLSLPGPYLYYRLNHNQNLDKELVGIAEKAAEIRRAHPRAALPPIVQVRFAEIEYRRRHYRRAIDWANAAMIAAAAPADPQSDAADAQAETVPARALYVRGASLQKQGRNRAAIQDFNAILARYPATPLLRSVREELAILYEAVGDLGWALDQYFALGYEPDIAFLIDVRMTVPELERYLRLCKGGTYRDNAMGGWRNEEENGAISRTVRRLDVLVYSLGIRCLRQERWDRAAYWLRQLPRETYNRFSRGRREWEGKPSPDPLTAARELGHLERTVRAARTNDARADALYRFASYYYSHGTLLLYNPALWRGEREIHFEEYWNEDQATAADLRAVRRYMHEHEVYARALLLYDEAARRYPRLPVAPRALYRAACSAARLSNFNGWWRSDDVGHDHLAQSANRMSRLYHRYPHSPLRTDAEKFAQIWWGEAEEAARNRREREKELAKEKHGGGG